MQTLTTTLEAAQKTGNIRPYIKCTFSKAGEDDVVVEEGRIKDISAEETAESQTIRVIFDNSDKYFTDLDFKGWTVVVQRGAATSSGTEYISLPPMKVFDQRFSSTPGRLTVAMWFIGIPNRLALDKASENYFNHWSNTKTVKTLFSEIADGQPDDTTLTEEQTTGETGSPRYLYSGSATGTVAGVALTITNRTVTKLAFKLVRVGAPGGNMTFKISQDDGGSVLESVTVAASEAPLTTPAFVEATISTPTVINERVWLTVEYTGGDASNKVGIILNSTLVKPDEAFVSDALDGAAASPDATWEDLTQECVYRYKYTAGTGDNLGVDCFDHCTAYEVVYDSEDSLIDVYLPANGFTILEGSTRLDALKKLLSYTQCVMRVEDDGKIHVFQPTITGAVYNYQYELDTRVENDAGSAATNRTGAIAALYTTIDLANPAANAQVLTALEVWAATNITGLRVGSFYLVSGTTYKCRDSVTLGAVTAGSKVTFRSFRLTVQAGDFIGCYFATGTLEASTSGGSGVVSVSGEYIDADDQVEYAALADYAISLYAYRDTEHEFFSKALRKALVKPNKITVTSYPNDSVQASGSATDATSFALLPIEDFIRATVTDGTQAGNIATAMIAQLQLQAQQGSASVPINLGAEVYDYVKVTDSRENDSRTGNIGWLRWSYRPGSHYRMDFGFGTHALVPIGGSHRAPIYRRGDTPADRAERARRQEMYGGVFEIPEEEEEAWTWDEQKRFDEAVYEDLQFLKRRVGLIDDEDSVSQQAWDAGYLKKVIQDTAPKLGGDLNLNGHTVTGLLANVVEDTTPQLGGDLDMNGKNIDFPTTPNISDCLDEDNMASNSATKLATQQSIKAYVDTVTLTKTQVGAMLCAIPLTGSYGGVWYSKTPTGTMTNPANINDVLDEAPNTASLAAGYAVGEYAEVDLGAYYLISQFRAFGSSQNSGTGKWKLQYKNLYGTWTNWATAGAYEIALSNFNEWSGWVQRDTVVTSMVRVVAVELDGSETPGVLLGQVEVAGPS